MSLFGSLMADAEDDPFFGSHVRHMRQMNNMMNSLFSDPFAMFGGNSSPLSIMGANMHSGHSNSMSMMPFMPQMPNLNRLFSNLDNGLTSGSSYSSSTVVMSNGLNGSPQVYSSTSSTKIGPHGIKETCKTLQDSRTGTKKMSIGHHIGERGHVIEREHNLYSGDQEERQEFINLDEDEAEVFDREFQSKAGSVLGRRAISGVNPSPSRPHYPSSQLALPAPTPSNRGDHNVSSSDTIRRSGSVRPSARRPIRASASPLTMSSSAHSNVREVYAGSRPQRKHRPHKQSRASPEH